MTSIRRLQLAATLLMIVIIYGCATTTDNTRMVGLVFDPGADTAEITDEISGAETVMYRFKGAPGQDLRVSLRPNNQHTEFLLYAPGKWPGDEMYNSHAGGNREYRGELYRDGMHAIQVYQTGGAGQVSKFDLVITLR